MTSPPVSMTMSTSALASLRTSVFNGACERMYGRAKRTSSTGAEDLAGRLPRRPGFATRRSYLPNRREHRVRPVVERMVRDHAATQLGAGLGSSGGAGAGDHVDCGRERLWIAR